MSGTGLALNASLAVILAAARDGLFLSFAQIADASGTPWPRARRAVGGHLRSVCRVALAQGGPMVSSIVVNRRHVRTGTMDRETLAGFVAAARDLGLAVEDPEPFLRAHQRETFAFARSPGGERLRAMLDAPDAQLRL